MAYRWPAAIRYGSGTSSCGVTPAGYASFSGYALPYTGASARPGLGVSTRPEAGTATGVRRGFLNHAFCPRYQIAVHSPRRSATA